MQDGRVVERVEALYGALRRGDLQSLLAGFAADSDVWVAGPRLLLPFVGRFRGRQGLKDCLALAGGAIEREVVLDVEGIVAEGARAVASGVATIGLCRPGAERLSLWFVNHFTLLRGEVVRLRAYFDTAEAAAALASEPEDLWGALGVANNPPR